MNNQRGQIIIVLLLVMLAALTVGLVITQRTVSDVSTSTQVEESSRAFSAAEAGLERAIQLSDAGQTITSVSVTEGDLGNSSNALVTVAANLPNANQAVEYPGNKCNPNKKSVINRENVAQFWLVNPSLGIYDRTSVFNDGSKYTGSKVAISFGDPATCPDRPSESPAIEANLVVLDSNGNFFSVRQYFDSVPSRGNNFTSANCPGGGFTPNTTVSSLSPFKCQVTLNLNIPDITPPSGFTCASAPTSPSNSTQCYPILIRIRILYDISIERVALGPSLSNCGNCQLPPQVDILASSGSSGTSQKVVNAYRFKNVGLPFFDYSIFSVAPINK
jgi:hypothetical protein